jgi:hypothetical protein
MKSDVMVQKENRKPPSDSCCIPWPSCHSSIIANFYSQKEDTMPTTSATIENLMKVSLTVNSGDNETSAPFEFIYGVGPQGITPFEKALFGKAVGDQVRFDLSPADYCETIGHLEQPLLKQTGIMGPVSLRVTIDGIVKAKDQEVVKAMASGGSCSDCGCGCGGH